MLNLFRGYSTHHRSFGSRLNQYSSEKRCFLASLELIHFDDTKFVEKIKFYTGPVDNHQRV